MLKALELVGFKSFADKTRFEFPAGITVVVGPNGSGKSNIVDAIKWVLGEQSAKSLRGKDMADVIFKGSGEGTRRMLNTAEATIIFENADGRLPVDAPEVHVTRRVYRSGEGEYLVNRQPCRLKDIKDLFRGTGVGTDAYSLIEQGKVDQMLQASPKDRRAIFEEAAGISRFKAKKVEAQRRLDRVEQNLLRLSDIVEEVESRLRAVRAQAAKARRYREYSERLQQLRTQVGQADWRALAAQLQAAENELAEHRNQAAEVAAQAEACEARALELDVDLAEIAETVRLAENRRARTREQIAARQSSVSEGHARLGDLQEAAGRFRRQLASMTGRAGDVHERLQAVAASLQEAESNVENGRLRAHEQEAELERNVQQLDQLRRTNQERRAAYLKAMQDVSELGNRSSRLQTQLDSQAETATRAQQRLTDLNAELQQGRSELQAAASAEADAADLTKDRREALDTAQQQAAALEQQLHSVRETLAESRRRCSATQERLAVLEELEKNYEGLTAGVREVLQRAQTDDVGPFSQVQGLVADLLHVNVDIAPLVDVALGDVAQYLALAGQDLILELQSGRFRPASRVGLIRTDWTDGLPTSPDLTDEPGVLGRLDRLIATPQSDGRFLARLLGTTWVVDSLGRALELHQRHRGQARFVSEGGELVESDGTVLAGPRHAGSALVSRRSELRACGQRADALDEDIQRQTVALTQTAQAAREQAQAVTDLEAQLQHASEQLSHRRAKSQALRERCELLARQQQAVQHEHAAARSQYALVAQELEQATRELVDQQEVKAQLDNEVRDLEQRISQVDARREHHARQANLANVELAKSEQQLAALREQMKQFEQDWRERESALELSRGQLLQSLARQQDTRLEILQSTAELAGLYLEREALEAQVKSQLAERDRVTSQKAELAKRLQRLRRQAQELDQQQHRCELAAGEVRHQRKTLAERLRDDYGIEVAELEEIEAQQTEPHRHAVDDEIADLRRKINNMGAVNMEALHELDQLEQRYQSLAGQFQDLTAAKESLERIIAKVNADSRRLFQDTLEAIRANFQSLYRKAFGGGRADLVLEEGVDVLEAGIDIIATPPGKPSFNNSLLSGGEKALTAVSLLLAIFQYRPSPFCVLDEVDAPFDEANIGRFVDVLKGFLGWTKFVIVTHSKKTMTAATTLYGVTMQESGVSKRVSVRFEDVSDDGHISQEAVEREDPAGEADERGAA